MGRNYMQVEPLVTVWGIGVGVAAALLLDGTVPTNTGKLVADC